MNVATKLLQLVIVFHIRTVGFHQKVYILRVIEFPIFEQDIVFFQIRPVSFRRPVVAGYLSLQFLSSVYRLLMYRWMKTFKKTNIVYL